MFRKGLRTEPFSSPHCKRTHNKLQQHARNVQTISPSSVIVSRSYFCYCPAIFSNLWRIEGVTAAILRLDHLARLALDE